MKLKKVLIILMITTTTFFTGCWSSREINTLAISVCTGIDKTENGYLLTQQVINPKAIASQKAISESPVVVYSETGKDLYETYRRLTTKCPRKIYNSHLRMVVFGEDFARDGIKDVIDFFARDHEFRTDFYFVVAKGTTANKILGILSPLEPIPALEMYNSLRVSESNWAPTKSIRIIELINSIISDGKNPVLTGVEITAGDENSNSLDALKQSNQITNLKFTHLGVFRKDKLVGWLSEEESKGYNYIAGNVKNTVGYVNYKDNIKITYEVINAKSKMKALLINDKPVINVEISTKINVAAVEGEFDVSKEENKNLLIEITEKKVKLMCENAVNKLQKEFKTDIFGFGEVIHRKYPKLWEKIKGDWNNEFTDIEVNISVKAKVNHIGQVTKPFFIKEKE